MWCGMAEVQCRVQQSTTLQQTGTLVLGFFAVGVVVVFSHYSTDSTSDRVTNEGLSFHHPWQAPGQDTGWAGGWMYPRLKL